MNSERVNIHKKNPSITGQIAALTSRRQSYSKDKQSIEKPYTARERLR